MKQLLFTILSILTCSGYILGQSAASDRLFSEGVSLYQEGNYTEAIEKFKKVKELDDKEIPPMSNRAHYGDIWLASSYYNLGNISRARDTDRNYFDMAPIDRRLTVESDSIGDLAIEAEISGDIVSALNYSLSCLTLEEQKLGPLNAHIVGTCNNIGNLYRLLGRKSDALAYYDKGIGILRELKAVNSISHADLLCGKIMTYLDIGDLRSATDCVNNLEKIMTYQQTVYDDKRAMATTHFWKARIYILERNTEAVTNNASKAFEIMLNNYSDQDEELFYSMTQCLEMLGMGGTLDKAYELSDKAVRVIETGKNPVHKGIMLSYAGQYSPDYDKAFQLLKQSVALLEGSEQTEMYLSTTCLLADLYIKQGDYEQALKLYSSVKKHYSPNEYMSGTYRRALMGMADTYSSLGDYEKANADYTEILNILSEDKKNPEYALTLLKWIPNYVKSNTFNYANGYQKGFDIGRELKDCLSNVSYNDYLSYGIGIPQLATVFLPFVQAILSNATISTGNLVGMIENQLASMISEGLDPVCGKEDYLTCEARALYAHCQYLQGNCGIAISMLNDLVDIARRKGYDYDNYIHDLAYYQYLNNDSRNAYLNFETGYNYIKRDILAKYRWMTLEERTKYTKKVRGNIDNLPHYAALTPDDRRYAELGYNVLLFSKGLLLNSTIELTRLLQEEGNEEVLKLMNKWKTINHKIELAAQKGSQDTKELKAESGRLEKQLLEQSRTYGDYTTALTVEYPDVQQALESDDVALEFFSYQADAKSRNYGVLLLSKEDKPRYIPIGNDSSWRHIDMHSQCYQSHEFFDIVFSGLKPYLPAADKGKIYFAADGIFHTIAIENLPGAEIYDMVRLSSTREVALRAKRSGYISSMALFGGISYGIGEIAWLNDAEDGKRGAGQFLSALPGTKTEVESIEHLLSPRISVIKKTGDEASEENFKLLSGKKQSILHIGTHGFYKQPDGAGEYEEEDLSNSGLFFAGAQNSIWEIDNEGMAEDGILTAREISQLDLRELKLAVLSACETGLGSISPEGVFGLQRGFKQAGAQALMMSLWKVDDVATQLLMTSFYQNLSKGLTPHQCLQIANNQIREKYNDPYYWAGFILCDALYSIDIQ